MLQNFLHPQQNQSQKLKNSKIQGEFGSTEVEKLLQQYIGKINLIIADPPYGEIIANDWDQNIKSENYMDWTKECEKYMSKGASLYMWGGIGSLIIEYFLNGFPKLKKKQV